MLFHSFFISCIVLLYLNLLSHFFTDVRVSAQLCLTLCDIRNCSLPGFSHHGILQARILEWVAISSSRGSLQPRDPTCVSCIGRLILYHWALWEAHKPQHCLLKIIVFSVFFLVYHSREVLPLPFIHHQHTFLNIWLLSANAEKPRFDWCSPLGFGGEEALSLLRRSGEGVRTRGQGRIINIYNLTFASRCIYNAGICFIS